MHVDDKHESRVVANLTTAFVALLLLLLLAAIIYGTYSFQEVKKEQIRRLSLVTGLVARSTESTLRHYEHGLRILGQRLRATNLMLHPRRSRTLLQRFARGNPELHAVIAVTPSGRILDSSRTLPAPLPNLSGPHFLEGARSAMSTHGLVVGPTKHGRIASGWIIPLRYAVRSRSGRVLFLLSAVLPVSREQALWNRLPPPAELLSGLLTDDGYLIFTWPPPANPSLVYDRPQTGILVRTLRARNFPTSGYVQGMTTVDSVPRLVVFRRLRHYPLTFWTTIPTRMIWMQWWHTVDVPYALLLLLAMGGGWTFRWTTRQQKEWENAQLDARRQLRRANRALRVLTEVNHSLVHAHDEVTLLRQACASLVQTGGYRMAWAGYAEHDTHRTIRPVAVSGHNNGYVEAMQLSWADTERGRGAAGTSIRERRPDIARDIATDPRYAPWRNAALARGYASSISLPLLYDSQVYGNFSLYSDQALAFDPEEVEILQQLANDMGYGIHSLRTRLAHTHAENQLRLAASALENTAEAVFITDVNARIIFVNKSFSTITGFLAEEVIARPWEVIASDRDSDSRSNNLRQALDESSYWQGELWARRKNGEPYPALFSITKVPEADGSVSHFVGVFNDISQYKDYQSRLEFLASHDALTGLPNRMLLRDRLEETIFRAQRDRSSAAVLFLDLDRFKSINDTLGHSVGDTLLLQVAGRLRDGVREIDTVARMGGDEFAIILSECRESSDVATLAHKLRELLSRRFVVDARELFVTASIGISCYPQDGDDVSTLLKNADIAMYRAKESGRNMYQFFSPGMNTQASEFMAMANNLHTAFDRDEFMLEFQPRHELASGRITGTEALLRWKHPSLGLVLPSQFIPLAEETGLVVRLGEWALSTACAQASAWEREGIPLSVAVNLSARQFREQDLVARMRAIIEASGVSPSLIEVEITESLMMQDPDTASRMLGELRAMGVESAIDDFGTGYSSLAYLKDFPVKYLKIDRRFLNELPGNQSDVAIVRTIIAIARSLELRLIAEGVENEAQRAFLLAEGCEHAQGYYFSRPMPAEALGDLLRTTSTKQGK